MTTAALSEQAIPSRRAEILTQVIGVIGFAGLTAIAAQIRIPLPGTPVPMTLQTLVVTMGALTLGARLGGASMALYLLVGLVGFPVFSGGQGGLEVVFGATGGYLVGFILAQPLIARLVRTRSGQYAGLLRLGLAIAAGYILIFTLGVLWLWVVTGSSLATAMDQGLWSLVPGMLAKVGIAFMLGTVAAPWAIHRGW